MDRDRVKYEVKYQDLPEEECEEWFENGYPEVEGRLCINPPLSPALVQKIKAIEGVGFIKEGVDYAAIFRVSLSEILLESNCGCVGFCREHGRQLISKILKILKENGEVAFSGFPL